MAEGVGFEPTELSLSGFQDRRLKPLGHPSEPCGTRSYVILSFFHFTAWDHFWYQSAHFGSFSVDVRLCQPPVPLGRDDGGVTQEFLKGSQTTTLLQPQASERVPQLVDMKLDPRQLRHLPGKGPVAGEGHQLPHPSTKLFRERHATHLPGLGLRDHEPPLMNIR